MILQKSRLPQSDNDADRAYADVTAQIMVVVGIVLLLGYCLLNGWAWTNFDGTMRIGVGLIAVLAPPLMVYLVVDYVMKRR